MAKKTKRDDEGDSDVDDDDDVPRKKRGQPTDFKGEHLEFLTGQIPDYIAAAKIKGKEAKTSGLPRFWAELFNKYWLHFPWDLPFDQDPDPNVAGEDEADTSLVPKLTPEQEEEKSKIQTHIKGVRLDYPSFFSLLFTDSRFSEN
jgi:hypothetical protein